MSNWNLPNGCTDDMIPGNRPQDIARDKWEEDNVGTIVNDFVEQNQELILERFKSYLLDGAYTALGTDIGEQFEKYMTSAFEDYRREE